jgi:hypothetical protein
MHSNISEVPEQFIAHSSDNEISVDSLHSASPGPHSSRPHGGLAGSAVQRDALGDPLTIEQVAGLIGCSAWTVRQRYLKQGLPHLRACAGGRIVFFREQVIAWILKRQQQKGGPIR